MKVSVSFQSRLVIFDFSLDIEDEKLLNSSTHMSNRSCFFELPQNVTKNDIHPDLLALSIVLSTFPFVKNEIILPFSISSKFSDIFYKSTAIKIGPVDKKIKSRKVIDGRPGLSYSAGVDSTAALALMPKNTVVSFLNRALPAFKKTLYDKSAAINTLKAVEKKYETYSILTNMEYVRDPIGFPLSDYDGRGDLPFSAAVPLLLIADIFKVDAIAYGIVMESLYLLGHEEFDDFSNSKVFTTWNEIFKVVDCELFFPTAGLSEVATSIVANKFSISKYVRSCMRGTSQTPCKKCIKCFRKLTLDQALIREGVVFKELIDNLQSREVIKNLYSKIKHENVYRYIVQNLKLNEFTEKFQNRIGIEGENTIWMEKWYKKSINLVPVKYQKEYELSVYMYLEGMNNDDIHFVENWGKIFFSNDDINDLFKWQEYLSTKIIDKQVDKFYTKLISEQNLRIIKEISFSDWKRTVI